jgi:hypothetical protein
MFMPMALCFLFNGVFAYAANPMSSAQEYELKAVFIYNLLNFINWPANSFAEENSPFQICLAGENPFDKILQLIVAQQQAAGRSLSLRQIKAPGQSAGCHLLFFSLSEQNKLRAQLGQLPPAALLTVSDIPRFAEQGGMVELYLKDNRLRLRIDHSRLLDSGLKANAQLLRLADIVNPVE